MCAWAWACGLCEMVLRVAHAHDMLFATVPGSLKAFLKGERQAARDAMRKQWKGVWRDAMTRAG